MFPFILFIVSLFLLLRLVILSWNILKAPYLSANTNPENEPSVAILIPARNEAHNLPFLLEDLKKANYQNLAIYVLDDNSSDRTADVVREFQTSTSNLNLLQGQVPPKGWLGKPWACHQLAKSANADYYLFVDADIRLSSDSIPAAISEMQKNKLSLYTLFPKQVVASVGEKLTVPVVYQTLATLLPLSLVQHSSNSAFSAANGQFMLMDGPDYDAYQWYYKVHDYQVEDMGIIKYMKKSGLRVKAAITHEHMSCRMYHGFKEAVDGFSKNFKAFFGDSWGLMAFYLLFGILGFFMLLFPYPVIGLSLILIEIVAVRALSAQMLGFCIRENIYMALPQMAVTVYLALVSFKKAVYKQNQWKGRPIP